jgi:hypothetical protein
VASLPDLSYCVSQAGCVGRLVPCPAGRDIQFVINPQNKILFGLCFKNLRLFDYLSLPILIKNNIHQNLHKLSNRKRKKAALNGQPFHV